MSDTWARPFKATTTGCGAHRRSRHSGRQDDRMTFICLPCKNQLHDKCDGITKSKTWCDCHHRPEKK